MAQISVTELLSDPDFVDAIQLVERKASLNSLGENIVKEVITDSVGSVQPASGKVLNRLPESLRVADVSSFFFKGKIVATAPGKYTSQLVFKGVRYNVQTVNDWSNFGEGYTEGLCIAERPTQ